MLNNCTSHRCFTHGINKTRIVACTDLPAPIASAVAPMRVLLVIHGNDTAGKTITISKCSLTRNFVVEYRRYIFSGFCQSSRNLFYNRNKPNPTPTFGRMNQFVQLLVPARAAAVQERVQRLLLAVLGQAAQPARARPGVHAARLALFERARQAAAAAGLLHQLAAHRHRGAHGQGLLVARLTRHERRAAAAEAEQWQQQQQQGNTHQHLGLSGNTAETATVINWIAMPIFPLRPVRVRTSGVGVPHPQVRVQQANVTAHDAPSPGHSASSAAAVQQWKEKGGGISERRVRLPSVMPLKRSGSSSGPLCGFFQRHALRAKCIICGFELAF